MPELIWNEYDFVEHLEVLPEVDDYKTRYHYLVTKHGLRLDLLVIPTSSEIRISIFQEGIERSILAFRMIDCSGIRYTNDKRGEYLEFAPSQVFGTRYEPHQTIPVGVRLSVKPSLSIEFF